MHIFRPVLPLRDMPSVGEIEVYYGPMCAAKSRSLIEDLLHRQTYGRQSFQLFHPSANTRDDGMCRSRTGQELPSTEFISVDHLETLIDPKTSTIGIDEAHFVIDPEMLRLLVKLRDRGHDIVCAGLDNDYLGAPFATIARIITLANPSNRHCLNAWCTECGHKARWSQLLEEPPKDGGRFIVGSENYAARCDRCFNPRW